jgi:hypothetical protein
LQICKFALNGKILGTQRFRSTQIICLGVRWSLSVVAALSC